jgi:hypothetical protein
MCNLVDMAYTFHVLILTICIILKCHLSRYISSEVALTFVTMLNIRNDTCINIKLHLKEHVKILSMGISDAEGAL